MVEQKSDCINCNGNEKGKTLVIGGTRGIGLEFVITAAANGFPVRLLARNSLKFNYAHKKLEVVNGNLLDDKSLQTALIDIENVVLTVGINPTFKNVTLFSEGTKLLIGEMENAGVKNLFCVTGVGAGDTKGLGGFLYNKIILKTLLKSMYEDKDRQEEIIKNSSLNWVLVRPGFLTNGKLTEKYKVLKEYNLKTKVSMISRADVADFLLKTLDAKKNFGKSVILTK